MLLDFSFFFFLRNCLALLLVSFLPLGSIHQLLPLLFGNNSKQTGDNAAAVSGNGVKKTASPAGAMVTVLHLKHTSVN